MCYNNAYHGRSVKESIQLGLKVTCVQVPLPPLSPADLHMLFRKDPGHHPVRLQGICVAMSTIRKEVYARHTRYSFVL